MAERLPYFYTYRDGDAFCVPCAEKLYERDPAFFADLDERYFTDHQVRCDNCGVRLGPINAEEQNG